MRLVHRKPEGSLVFTVRYRTITNKRVSGFGQKLFSWQQRLQRDSKKASEEVSMRILLMPRRMKTRYFQINSFTQEK